MRWIGAISFILISNIIFSAPTLKQKLENLVTKAHDDSRCVAVLAQRANKNAKEKIQVYKLDSKACNCHTLEFAQAEAFLTQKKGKIDRDIIIRDAAIYDKHGQRTNVSVLAEQKTQAINAAIYFWKFSIADAELPINGRFAVGCLSQQDMVKKVALTDDELAEDDVITDPNNAPKNK